MSSLHSKQCLDNFTGSKKVSGKIIIPFYRISKRRKFVSVVATIRVEPSVLVFLAFISKAVNNQCYNPYIFGKIFSRSFQKCRGCSIDC